MKKRITMKLLVELLIKELVLYVLVGQIHHREHTILLSRERE